MAGKTKYLEKKILDHVLRGVTYTAPTHVYVALFTSATADDGSGTECSGTGYTRFGPLDVGSGFEFNAASLVTGSTSNSGDWTWSIAGGSWGTITHAALYDASTSGNMLYHGPVTTQKTVSAGDQYRILSGGFVVGED